MKFRLSLLSIVLAIANPMLAVAAVTPGNVSVGSSASSPWTLAHTVSATSTNAYMTVGFVGASTDIVTSVTYRGEAMTFLAKLQNNNGLGRWAYLYGYAPTSTGGGDIVVTAALTDNLSGVALSYGGVGSIGNVTSTNPNGNLTSLALGVTTTVTGARLTGWFYADAGGLAAGADTALRGAVGNSQTAFDSLADLGVAGNYILNVTMNSSHITAHEVVLNPVSASVASAELTPVPIGGGVSDSGGSMSL